MHFWRASRQAARDVCLARHTLPMRARTAHQAAAPPAAVEPPDHRKLGREQSLFFMSEYSPGSPIFLPHGAIVFNRLVDFMRRLYVAQGFKEVITPLMFKTALWRISGHLDHYARDMFAAVPGTRDARPFAWTRRRRVVGDDGQVDHQTVDTKEVFGLKPMNCPGHCLIYSSKQRSYRDLPLRYADFGALHRNEPSGALSGLMRTRCFHQDDGHVFCRPVQVEDELRRALALAHHVYHDALRLPYTLALSTRPADGSQTLGSEAEWAQAEDALIRALQAEKVPWTRKPGDGAFYGPKIDIAVHDATNRPHQTATIQLDMQLPRRLGLEYDTAVPDVAADDRTDNGLDMAQKSESGTPVLIHRAVLGSVERLMALLVEKHAHPDGQWPFWLNPRQAIVMTVTSSDAELALAHRVHDVLLGCAPANAPLARLARQPRPTGLAVEMDLSTRPLGGKIRNANLLQFGAIIVIGPRDAAAGSVVLNGRTDAPLKPEALLAVLLEKVNSFA